MKHTRSASCSMAPDSRRSLSWGRLPSIPSRLSTPRFNWLSAMMGDIQLFGQSLERTRDGAHLFLTASERHSARIHQLKVVDDDDSHPMLTHQTAGLCTQFEHRERRRVVHIERRVVKFLNLIVEAAPIRKAQAARSLSCRPESHTRSQSDGSPTARCSFRARTRQRRLAVYRHVFGHRKDKGSFSHRRTRRDDDQVGVLPARSHLVELVESACQTAQTVGARRSLLKHVIRFLNHRINLRIVFLHVLLGDFEELSLSFLHQVVHILRFVESLGLYLAGESDQLARQKLLRDDARMVFDMG